MPRHKAGFNADGTLSFFDRVVFPTAGKAHAGKMEQQLNSNVAATTYNPNFQGSEIDRQQQSAAIQDRQAQNFDRRLSALNAVSGIQDQLLGRPAQSQAGSVNQVERTVQGIPGVQTGPTQDVGGGIISGVAPGVGAGGAIRNPFVDNPVEQKFKDNVNARSEANTSKAAQEYAAIGEALGRGVPPWRLQQAQQAFAQKYPQFAQTNPLRALSSAEAQQIKQTIKLQQHQAQIDAAAQAEGVATTPLIMNDKGQPEVVPGWTEHLRVAKDARAQQASQAAQNRDQREQQFRAATKTRHNLLEQFQKNVKNPYDATEQRDDWFGFEQMRERKIREFGDFEKEQRKIYFPEEFGQEAPKPKTLGRERLQTAKQIGQASGITNVVVDQDDFDALQLQANATGEVQHFVDAETNELLSIKPANR